MPLLGMRTSERFWEPEYEELLGIFMTNTKLKNETIAICSKYGHSMKDVGGQPSLYPCLVVAWPGRALVFVLLSSLEAGLQLVSGCPPAAGFLSRPPWWQLWVGSRQGGCELGVAIPPRRRAACSAQMLLEGSGLDRCQS